MILEFFPVCVWSKTLIGSGDFVILLQMSSLFQALNNVCSVYNLEIMWFQTGDILTKSPGFHGGLGGYMHYSALKAKAN